MEQPERPLGVRHAKLEQPPAHRPRQRHPEAIASLFQPVKSGVHLGAGALGQPIEVGPHGVIALWGLPVVQVPPHVAAHEQEHNKGVMACREQ